MSFILRYNEIHNTDIALVGGKNASLGEMVSRLTIAGIKVPAGFAITVAAWQTLLQENRLEAALAEELTRLDTEKLTNLASIGKRCRALIGAAKLPDSVTSAVTEAYRELDPQQGFSVAVRSSATAEDLPDASFAGQHDSFLNVSGIEALLQAVQNCYVSLYNDRAIKYREDHKIAHLQVALSVGVQYMVRSDLGSAGVAFTLDPESGNTNIVYLTSAWGLGENVVQGAVSPDEFILFKPALGHASQPLIHKRLGAKELRMTYSTGTERPVINQPTTPEERSCYSLSDTDAITLGRWCLLIEAHYGMPMDIEWARDGNSAELFIVQARPETVYGQEHALVMKEYQLQGKAEPVCAGKAVGHAIASGRACIVNSLADADKVQDGDIIVADITNPDWNTMLRKAVSIVTNKGGRTSHASIVARELGIHAVVGTGTATTTLQDGQIITVDCSNGDQGQVFDGKLDWQETELSLGPGSATRTKPMLILADPDKAFDLARYPTQGVGLLRMEFIINNSICVHPMALINYDQLPEGEEKSAIATLTATYSSRTTFFVEQLSRAVALVGAAFYPREVIVRMSDFKSNEYRQLLGGSQFEPEEENPMLGFRGASRYYHPLYREGFGLECEAMRTVRDEMGLTNIKLMIPFCRTVEEGKQVLATMQDFGLQRRKNGLEIYVMAEIPSNVLLADEFASIFDGFSIGSNDLTQLTLGIDRDSAIISELFDENNPAVKQMLSSVIKAAQRNNVKIGLCGQAPSDYPEFAQFLVEQGINSIAFNADALVRGIDNIRQAENRMGK